ncbi:unnamed protein product [Ectocarpus sp. 4 AP-2014]
MKEGAWAAVARKARGSSQATSECGHFCVLQQSMGGRNCSPLEPNDQGSC